MAAEAAGPARERRAAAPPRTLLRRASLCAVFSAAAPAVMAQVQPGSAGEATAPPLGTAAPAAEGAAPAPVGAELGLPGGVPGTPAPVRLGGFFGFPFAGTAAPVAGAGASGWNITPSLTLRLRGTDNRFLTTRDRQADLITDVIPGLAVTADTERVQGRLNYAPTFQFYASDPGERRFNQFFNGAAVAAVVPGSLFLDLRGLARTQAISGGFAPEGQDVTTRRRNLARTYNFQATPYYVHRFGGTATALAGYAFQYAEQQGTAQAAAPGTLPFFRPQEFTSHTGFAAVRTGEDFGRLAFEARVSGTTYIGTGIFDGARRNIGTVEARYAVLRGVAVLGEIGYEDLRYATAVPFRVNEPVWAVGVRLDPGPDSVIFARYGHREGFNSAALDASVALSGRTRLIASYSDRLGVSIQRGVDLLSTTSVDEYGNAVDTQTGAPALLPVGNSFLALQSGLFRIKRARVSLAQTWPQDTVTLTLSHEDRRPVAAAPNTVALAQRGTYGTVTWAHALALRTTTVATVQYGRVESTSLGTKANVFLASAGLAYQFSPTLFGSLQYMLTNRETGLSEAAIGLQTGTTTVQNMVLATLRQLF